MRVILMDGSGFMHRLYHAGKGLVRSDGMPVSAIHGVCTMLWGFLRGDWRKDRPATHIGVFFDKGSLTWRNVIYPDYKLNRPGSDDALTEQKSFVFRAVRAFGLPVIELSGYEADDLIATYMRLSLEAGADDVMIVSSDKDFLQFVSDDVCVYDPYACVAGMGATKGKIYRGQGVIEKFGVSPNRITDAQALIGDAIDNVPGVPRIGAKGAAGLINKYGALEDIIAAAERGDIARHTIRDSLIAHKEQALLAKRLVTMRQDAPVTGPIDALAVKPIDHEALVSFLDEMEFRLLSRQIAYAFNNGFSSKRLAS